MKTLFLNVKLVGGLFLLAMLFGLLSACAANPAEAAPEDIEATAQDAGKTITLKVGQTLRVSLEGNPSTGYTWEMVAAQGAVLSPVGEPVFKAASDAIGAGGRMTLTFKADAAGEQALKLIYHRVWEKDVPAINTFEMKVVVK